MTTGKIGLLLAALGGFALPLLCVGCGGGGDDLQMLTIPSDSAIDGFVGDNLFVDTIHPIAVGDADLSFSNVTRGFVRFSLLGVPAGATVVSAELRISQFSVVGTPYSTHGNIVVDHVNIGTALDATDYNLALEVDIGTLSTSAAIGFKTLSVRAQVLADLAAARTTSDFRLRFEADTDMDGEDDYASFNAGEDPQGDGTVPVLVLTYEGP